MRPLFQVFADLCLIPCLGGTSREVAKYRPDHLSTMAANDCYPRRHHRQGGPLRMLEDSLPLLCGHPSTLRPPTYRKQLRPSYSGTELLDSPDRGSRHMSIPSRPSSGHRRVAEALQVQG